jgi:hypothetical protein
MVALSKASTFPHIHRRFLPSRPIGCIFHPKNPMMVFGVGQLEQKKDNRSPKRKFAEL